MPDPAAELLTALRDLAQMTALTEAEITEAVEQAVADTYRRLVEDDPEVRARVDLSSATWRVYRLDGGAELEMPAAHGDFARQAAAAARAAVAERLVEADRRHILAEAASHRGQLIDAIVERRAGSTWYVDAAGVPGVLPPEEQIPGERVEPRQHLKVVVIDGKRRGQDTVVVVSRSHPVLVQRLMEQEVPELQSGQVVIRGIARDPGKRTKVAVEAPDGEIDPQGACIGPRGVRQRAVTSELGEEQVQIIAWASDPATYVANALIPASAQGVTLDEETHTAHVAVPAEQLSLAIGRAGENARLAAKLSGWRIDIRAAGGE
jgi:N utilization substance protein A